MQPHIKVSIWSWEIYPHFLMIKPYKPMTYNIQIKICAEYRGMLPRPRLVCQEPGLRPIGRSPGVPDKSSRGLAPVPLSIIRSNSKFDENSERFSVEYTRPISTIFCTRHDSGTVVTCAKYRCDRPRMFYTGVFWIFIEFRIRSKHA